MVVDRVVRHERRQGLEAGCRGMGQSPAERGAVDVGRNTTQCDAMRCDADVMQMQSVQGAGDEVACLGFGRCCL